MTHEAHIRVVGDDLDERSLALRRLVVRGLDGGKRGHMGSAFSLIEMLRVLYDDILRFDPKNPTWADRDRCILSKGHGCLALYAILADRGFFPAAELDRFCQFDGMLGGHPERAKVPGVEASTGALGHGLSIGLGQALAMRLQKRDSRVFVIMGDGEINEGSVWEAALCAGKHRLSNLVAMVDYNKLQSYDRTSIVQDLEPLADKWRAFGFDVREVDGHDVDQLHRVLSNVPFDSGKPSAIICHTVKGRGIAVAEGNPEWHHRSKINDDEVAAMYAELE
ncbi:MAG: transketolase [Proteobacteria bacterium]|nr:transketolase [Pseudomonadota bacterium]MDA1057296.1 transketolase [Pseudomonadota bacterium]